MEKIKFSFIVPVYNVEKYLSQCVDSLLNQTYTNFEIILVDDGSLDNCPQMCDEYDEKDSRIKVIHKENGGLVSARKEGALIATGDYIVCVDSDDWVELDYLEKVNKVIDGKSVDIIFVSCYWVCENQIVPKHVKINTGLYDKSQIKKDLFPKLFQTKNAKYLTPSVVLKVFKRELYLSAQLKVPNEVKIAEDIACSTLAIYNANSIYVTGYLCYYYRQNLSSMTKNRKPFEFSRLEVFVNHIRDNFDLTEYDFQEQYYRLVEQHFFNYAVSQFYRKEKYRTVKKDILNEMKKEPFKDVLGKAKFKGSKKAWLMHFALKHKLIWLMWLYSRVK